LYLSISQKYELEAVFFQAFILPHYFNIFYSKNFKRYMIMPVSLSGNSSDNLSRYFVRCEKRQFDSKYQASQHRL